MLGRIPLLVALLASLALAGQASAHGRDAVINGVVIGGSIAVHGRYGHVPVSVEIGAPPPRVVYYEPYPHYYQPPVYYHPYPVVITPHYKYKSPYHRHHYRRHPHHRGYYAAPRW